MSSSHEWPDGEYSVRNGWAKRPSDIDKLAPAFIKAQGLIEGALKDSNNPHFKSKYADLSSVWAAAKPALQACGLGVMQPLCESPPGFVGILTVLVHESGQTVSSKALLPFKDAANPQAAGSAITYARRYALSSLLGICPEDDDGNGASKGGKPATDTLQKQPIMELSVAKQIVEWKEALNKAKTVEEKKKVFMNARGTNIPEPEKTMLLTEMSNTIKGMK